MKRTDSSCKGPDTFLRY